MNLKIIYDSPPCPEGLCCGWGFSCLLDGRLLFDTGDNFPALENNLLKAGVAPAEIKEVFISHEHADHAGGLPGLLERYGRKTVHLPAGTSSEFRKSIASSCSIIEHARCESLGGGFFSTGAAPFVYKGLKFSEQSLVARTAKGLVVTTGCAHTGIAEIVRGVRENFPGERITLLAGGFHLRDGSPEAIVAAAAFLRAAGVERVAPCHCSGAGASAYLAGAYGAAYFKVPAGSSVDI
ncbi:MAG: MBL fold metallo-hydrolase [Elusimicrobiales bacterium]